MATPCPASTSPDPSAWSSDPSWPDPYRPPSAEAVTWPQLPGQGAASASQWAHDRHLPELHWVRSKHPPPGIPGHQRLPSTLFSQRQSLMCWLPTALSSQSTGPQAPDSSFLGLLGVTGTWAPRGTMDLPCPLSLKFKVRSSYTAGCQSRADSLWQLGDGVSCGLCIHVEVRGAGAGEPGGGSRAQVHIGTLPPARWPSVTPLCLWSSVSTWQTENEL